ncbi:hypothetical protein EPIR_0010 [Erwinia piriflorinigrans CFBP 5888]|uniref:Uncharacterized protein n=1 Tax=Erwinia piriflorinigrans CFBP 5888 TaxID=1161919 RepID=V5Z2M2_9GAMM|nr:hypothetical protein EPIR_0010 [Erwinia piriflorinigrans CFBP 5888]
MIMSQVFQINEVKNIRIRFYSAGGSAMPPAE